MGNHVDYATAFLGGMLLSFTPCVYPLIPISAGFIGIKAGSSKLRGLFLSLIYVTGVAITYSALGLLASLTGKFFGAVTTNPITYILVGAVIVMFGLSMFDIFTISLPHSIKLPVSGKQGFLSAFFLGLSSGLIVSPCITPALGTILVYLATKKNILYGTTLLFSFAYGMGFVLILTGSLSTILLGLPKSGKWMIYIKRSCALFLLGMGLYFIFKGIRRF